jgi:hypothetical protein
VVERMMDALIGAFVLAVALLVVVVIDLLRSHGRLLRTLHELDPASEERGPVPRRDEPTES